MSSGLLARNELSGYNRDLEIAMLYLIHVTNMNEPSIWAKYKQQKAICPTFCTPTWSSFHVAHHLDLQDHVDE